ncbi:type II toxin-antitoxin system PemK/MazF family toxin [Desulfofundulus salinus]|uniref:type II toxin-antitoxin system PemK/MazF family toxin n=1 Tax=Desulfofundulus salinus TaxID=2419843 RepID=UPI001A9B667D|nr:type II toxin-antitoxin system PemK/MazF family toxin [Desulfofundulus salinum]
MEIKRGDVFLVDFNPARGSEQAGIRSACSEQCWWYETILPEVSPFPEKGSGLFFMVVPAGRPI